MGRAREILLGMALGAVGFHVFLTNEMRLEFLAPVGLRDVAGQRVIPVLIIAVRVFGFKTSALAVMADRAAEVCELVTPFPAPVALYIAQRSRIGMRLQRLKMIFETRIVDREMTGGAAVHAVIAELRHDNLFNLRTAVRKLGALTKQAEKITDNNNPTTKKL